VLREVSGASDVDGAVGVSGDGPVGVVDEPVVEVTHVHGGVVVGAAAVFPVLAVVEF
jgi:hypothetical protein